MGEGRHDSYWTSLPASRRSDFADGEEHIEATAIQNAQGPVSHASPRSQLGGRVSQETRGLAARVIRPYPSARVRDEWNGQQEHAPYLSSVGSIHAIVVVLPLQTTVAHEDTGFVLLCRDRQ